MFDLYAIFTTLTGAIAEVGKALYHTLDQLAGILTLSSLGL